MLALTPVTPNLANYSFMISSRSLALVLAAVLMVVFSGCGKKESSTPASSSAARSANDFVRLMNTGKNYLDQGQGSRALEVYQSAAKLAPADPDVHLNLANTYLLLGDSAQAVKEADETLRLDKDSGAAWFVKGAAWMRAPNYEEALKALQNARNLEFGEHDTALSYLLGVAHLKLGHFEEAIAALTEVVTALADHHSAHYQLSQAFSRAGRELEAKTYL
jgi:tetratricopeptide (TPR) repeat protein